MEIKFAKGFWKSYDKCFSRKPWYAIPRWFSDTWFKIICAYERVRYGYDRTWTWSLDWQLAEILPKVIRELKENKNGYPANETSESWEIILEDMALGFDASFKLLDLEYMVDDKEKEGHYVEDKEMRENLEKQFEKGMDLFKKYFFDLWD